MTSGNVFKFAEPSTKAFQSAATATVNSSAAGSITLNFSVVDSGAALSYGYCVFDDVQFKIQSYTKPTSTGADSSTGWGFTPVAALSLSAQKTSSSSVTADIGMLMGIADGTNQYQLSGREDDAQASSDTNSAFVSEFIDIRSVAGTARGNTDVTFSSNTMSFNWSNNDTTADHIYLMGFATEGGGATPEDANAVFFGTNF